MKVLVINSGSSSVKYQLINTENRKYLAKGLVERIGLTNSKLKHQHADGEKMSFSGVINDHQTAIEFVLAALTNDEYGVISDLNEIDAVGHRLVHGGEHFSGSVLITPKIMEVLKDCIDLAPLHNPPNIKGVKATQAHLKDIPMVGVFDTAFHSTIPDYAYTYGIPYELYKKHSIRRYGFHGTSHYYISQKFAELNNKKVEDLKLITCHLGNGASITAIKNGKSIDTSMGFTPLEGLLMGTRSGDIDPGALIQIMAVENISRYELNILLNKHSGIQGISELSSDMREIEEAIENGNKKAELAMNVYNYRLKKYISSYAGALGGLDGIIFTGGIGENGPITRAGALKNLEFMGIKLDEAKNEEIIRGKTGEISTDDSPVKVMVIPTNEELVIAMDTEKIIEESKKK
ncbi:MAG: acetate kinase [Candidatus Marinimicrobia bacterium]|nr:acetate kinase [Candidatus Neomarinimicrobiota bacterium]